MARLRAIEEMSNETSSDKGIDDAKAVLIPNHFGEESPCKIVEIRGKIFVLGGLSENAKTKRFSFGWVAYEPEKGTAFVFLDSGEIYRHDSEDEAFGIIGANAVFYSDAGLSVFSEIGEVLCVFNDFNQYFIDIDFTEILDGTVSFTLGDMRTKRYTINEIVDEIGVAETSGLVLSVSDVSANGAD